MKFADVRSWHYQLQGKMPTDFGADCYVIDIDTPEPYVRSLRDAGKCVLAYFSVGEAEDYRAYWAQLHERKASDDVLLGENPEWKGNYAVKFWDLGWHYVVENRVHEAKAKGFTGLYLDKCDVIWDIEERWPRIARTRNLEQDMILLINKIAATEPELEVIMQNAEDLLEHIGLLKVLDGIAKEDWLFGEEDTGVLNQPDRRTHITRMIDRSGLPVIGVEYIDHDADRSFAEKWYAGRGVPLFLSREDRQLDR